MSSVHFAAVVFRQFLISLISRLYLIRFFNMGDLLYAIIPLAAGGLFN